MALRIVSSANRTDRSLGNKVLHTYAGQCVAGLQGLVVDELRKADASFDISVVEDGFVSFSSSMPPSQFTSLPFLSVSFVVLAKQAGELARVAPSLSDSTDWHAAARGATTKRERTFRLMVSESGQLVSLGSGQALRLIREVCHTTRLALAEGRPDAEFWLIRRRSGMCYFCKRISRPLKDKPQRGELRPDLAHLLCLLSEPDRTDIFVDPFAGSGAIPFVRTKFPYDMIFAMDRDEANVLTMKEWIKEGRRGVRERKGRPIIIRQGDARQLSRMDAGFVSKIVTDPPWGEYEDIPDLRALYLDSTTEMTRVLRPGGILIMLLGHDAIARVIQTELAGYLSLEKTTNVLVSGKPAVVAKWRRKQQPWRGPEGN